MRRAAALLGLTLLATSPTCAEEEKLAPKPLAPEALVQQIKALQAPRVAWRQIAWKSCLLEGLTESRAKSKPVLLWVFIDRPTDDARC
jgi:hypothetical protein